jgi:predicted RecA/RadA family phage recombinase
MKNYIQPGNTITWTNTGETDVASGDVVVVGSILGVAAVAIPAGASGELATSGVFECPKAASAVIAQGEGVIWDASESAFDDAAASPATGDVSGAAVAWAAAGNGATVVKVRLGNVGTVA